MYPVKNINNLINVIDYDKLIKQQANTNVEDNKKTENKESVKTLKRSKEKFFHQKIGN